MQKRPVPKRVYVLLQAMRLWRKGLAWKDANLIARASYGMYLRKRESGHEDHH